jgi:hypothetical protein
MDEDVKDLGSTVCYVGLQYTTFLKVASVFYTQCFIRR